MRAALWNTRSALLYSIGGWTMLGGVLHYSYKNGGRNEGESDDKANEELSRDVVTSKHLGLQVTTVVTYHKELPPLTRLLRRMTAYFTASGTPPPSED